MPKKFRIYHSHVILSYLISNLASHPQRVSARDCLILLDTSIYMSFLYPCLEHAYLL
ncbi:hypothetical protein GUJ93_ZPchr0013g37364 [Zizania palustris]|uniref:Uncharacterized protein n=1 Tax=Zizania palustris TaxID=103762 RepID=A0A8J6BTT3_ZIZPA|nr:hypothetical protein GUJ93_ZPchr0013g37364 [Zizania palustris]